MKITLDLTHPKDSRLYITDVSHSEALHIIDDLLDEFNDKLANKEHALKYMYIPGPLQIFGKEKWIRLFATVNHFDLEIKYNFPPMPFTDYV